IGGKRNGFERTSQRGIGNRRSENFGEGRSFRLALAHDDGAGDEIAYALVSVRSENRNQPDRIEHDRLDVDEAQEVSHHGFKETNRPAIFANHAQLQPTLYRGLSSPQPFKQNEVSVPNDECDDDEQRSNPLWHA